MRFILISLLIFLASCKEHTIIKIILDGDTYITSTGEQIRLSEVDCPETEHNGTPAQPYAEQAKRLAERKLLYKSVTIKRTGKKTYGRSVADVYTPEGENFAEILIKVGLAHITPWTKNPTLVWEYRKAKNNNIGLFQSSWEYPYIYKRKHKIK